MTKTTRPNSKKLIRKKLLELLRRYKRKESVRVGLALKD